MDSFIVLDLETTGLQPKHDRILEIGALKVVNGQVVDTFHKLINPKMQIPERITELTGITQQMADEGEDAEHVIRSFLEFSADLPLLGHNILFDFSFVKAKAVNMGCSFEKSGVDTLKIARKVLPNLPRKGLIAMCQHYGIEQEQAHRALDDASNTWKLYQHLKQEFYVQNEKEFAPQQLVYQVKKQGPITSSQKLYLNDLIKYHRIDKNVEIESLTKSEASRLIDYIILNYGRIQR